MSLLLELAQATILGASLLLVGVVSFAGATAWGRLLERFADSGCTCRRYGWDPGCPVHGRKDDREPFPGAKPW